MRTRNDQKRQQILQAASKLFAAQPFHKVRLDDVAAAAGVGKGTLYIYFGSKDDLYFTLLYEGFAEAVDRLRRMVACAGESAWARLRKIVQELVALAYRDPQMWELMRTVGPPRGREAWAQKRTELADLVERTIEEGNAHGELADENPALTALFIPGLVRSAVLHGPPGLDQQALVEHILRLLERGIVAGAVGHEAIGPNRENR